MSSVQKDYRLANMSLLCAALVVFIHISGPKEFGSAAWCFHYIFRSIFATIAVPYFFCASGYFVARHIDEEGWFSRELKKRITSLLVPYLIWCVAWAIYQFCLGIVGDVLMHRQIELDWGVIFSLRAWGLDLTETPALFPIWFIRALMCFVLLSPLFVALLKRIRWVWVLLIVAVNGAYNIWSSSLPSPWSGFFYYGLSLSGLLYFTIGLSLKDIPKRNGGRIAFALGVILGVCGLVLGYYGLEDWPCREFFMTGFLLWGVWTSMPSWKLPKWATGLSFPIYLLHLFFILALALILPHTSRSIVRMTGEYGIVLALSVCTTILFKRYFPRFSAVVFGGRI